MKVADHSCTKFSVKVMYYCPKVVIELPEEEQMVMQEEKQMVMQEEKQMVMQEEKAMVVQQEEKAMVVQQEKAMVIQQEEPLTEEQRFKVETSSPRFKTQYTEMR